MPTSSPRTGAAETVHGPPRPHGLSDGWFLDVRNLGPWRSPDAPPPLGWVVFHIGEPHPRRPEQAILVLDLTRRDHPLLQRRWRWTPLPLWPRTSHARLAALRDASRLARLRLRPADGAPASSAVPSRTDLPGRDRPSSGPSVPS